jgi:hypothetical protein
MKVRAPGRVAANYDRIKRVWVPKTRAAVGLFGHTPNIYYSFENLIVDDLGLSKPQSGPTPASKNNPTAALVFGTLLADFRA